MKVDLCCFIAKCGLSKIFSIFRLSWKKLYWLLPIEKKTKGGIFMATWTLFHTRKYESIRKISVLLNTFWFFRFSQWVGIYIFDVEYSFINRKCDGLCNYSSEIIFQAIKFKFNSLNRENIFSSENPIAHLLFYYIQISWKKVEIIDWEAECWKIFYTIYIVDKKSKDRWNEVLKLLGLIHQMHIL